jgi:hypothetical protein
VKERSLKDEIPKITGGLLELVRRAGAQGAPPPVSTRTALQDGMRETGQWLALKEVLWSLLRPDIPITEDRWKVAVDKLVGILGPLLQNPDVADVQDFLKWSPAVQEAPVPENVGGETDTNVFVHQAGENTLRLRVDSIHGVKGETHAATLVVETFMNRTHDIKSVLPVLCGKKAATSLTGSAIGHCKRIFVGITRPRELVCLAIYREHVGDKDVAYLEKAGWIVKCL